MVNNVLFIALVMLLPAQAFGAPIRIKNRWKSVTTPFLLLKTLDRIGLAKI